MPAEAATRTRVGTASLALSLVGLAVSAYLTIEHYAAPTVLACPDTGAISCQKVTTSSWSMIGPVPMALLGLLWFAGMAVLTTPVAWRQRSLDAVRVAGAVAGVVSVVYLVWVELYRVEAICLWCTVVHAAAVALLVSILWTTTGLRE